MPLSTESIQAAIHNYNIDKSYEISTTPLNALSTFSGSKKISKTGKLTDNKQKQWIDSIQEMIFHRKAFNKHQKDYLSGEEIVVKISKY